MQYVKIALGLIKLLFQLPDPLNRQKNTSGKLEAIHTVVNGN